jgi:MFS family permease
MQKELKIILITSILLNVAAGFFGPLYAVFVENIGGDLVTAGSSFAVFTIASGILVFFISRWEDHVKHQEKLIIIGRGLTALAFFGYLFVNRPLHLFLVQGLLGVGLAIGGPAAQSVYTLHLDKGRYASQWGLWGALASIVAGLAAIVGGFLANVYGFRFLFAVMFIFSFLAFVFSFALLEKKGKRK